MLGAIIGDAAGADYEVLEVQKLKQGKIRTYEERMKIMDPNIPLLNEKFETTDDSCLTVAIADAILNNKSYADTLKEYGMLEMQLGLDKYGRSRFGKGFIKWLEGNSEGTSYGNGCAMRIGPVGYLFDSIEKIKYQSYLATIPSHNHPESKLCAEAVAISIYALRKGVTKKLLRDYLNKNYFNVEFDLEDLRHNYSFTSRAINSVPQAIFCFLVSNSFEDAIRISLSIGGDADTIACITGSLAESYYGLDEQLVKNVKPYLKDYMKPVINQFYKEVNKQKVLK